MIPNAHQKMILEKTEGSFMDWLPDTVGCFGTIIILIVYLLLQTRRLSAHSFLFSSLNLVGGLMILVSLVYNWNLAAVFMEASWTIISAYGMIKILYPRGFKRCKRKFAKGHA